MDYRIDGKKQSGRHGKMVKTVYLMLMLLVMAFSVSACRAVNDTESAVESGMHGGTGSGQTNGAGESGVNNGNEGNGTAGSGTEKNGTNDYGTGNNGTNNNNGTGGAVNGTENGTLNGTENGTLNGTDAAETSSGAEGNVR